VTPDNPSLPDDPRQRLQEKILADHPRLGPDDRFTFACHPGVSCYNKCCGDVNIFLSPYDVLRLKKRLGMASSEFLEKHALMPVQKDMKTPVVVLRMNDDEAKSCPFLTDAGCGLYTDRPWPCRMYPLGLAAQKDTPDGWRGDRFHFLLREAMCKGHGEAREWTVREWKELTLHKFFEEGGTLAPEKMHMFFTACYDLDRFREFVFDSTLLKRFEMDEDFVEELRYDDDALLRFAFLWLRFSLFGEPTMKPKQGVVEAYKGTLEKKGLFKEEPAKAPKEAR
jgi:Fe-S-cluster containining protein